MIFNPKLHKSVFNLPPFRIVREHEETIGNDIVIIEITTLNDVFNCWSANQIIKKPNFSNCKSTLLSPLSAGDYPSHYRDVWGINCLVIRFCGADEQSTASRLKGHFSYVSTPIFDVFRHFYKEEKLPSEVLKILFPHKDLSPVDKPKPSIRLHPFASKPLPLP